MPRPLVLVHGTRTSSAIWRDQVRVARSRGHEVATVDLPGHGSRRPERFELTRAVAVIGEAVDRMASPPLLVGMSLGGYLSMAFAAGRPGHVAGLLLSGCSTEIRGKPLDLFRRLAHQANSALHVGGPSWDVVSDMLRAMRGYSAIGDLRRVDAPVWLVNGRRDPLRLDERRLLRAAPRGRLRVVPRAGHDVNLHAPEAFNALLLRALDAAQG